MNNFYVYQILDPRDDSIIYIGKGSTGRHLQHLDIAKEEIKKNKRVHDNPKLVNKLKKFIELGLDPIYKFPYGQELDEDTAFQKEGELTRLIGLENLCNLKHSGKGGFAGYNFTLEMNKENSERVKKIWKQKTQEQRELEESRRRKTREARTVEEQEKINEVRSKAAILVHSKKTQEQKDEFVRKCRETRLKNKLLKKENGSK